MFIEFLVNCFIGLLLLATIALIISIIIDKRKRENEQQNPLNILIKLENKHRINKINIKDLHNKLEKYADYKHTLEKTQQEIKALKIEQKEIESQILEIESQITQDSLCY